MNMKLVFDRLIGGGAFDLKDVTDKVHYYHAMGQLSTEEAEELITRAQEAFTPAGQDKVGEKLKELDARVRELENAVQSLQANGNDEPDEYVPGHWCHTGDQVMFEGEKYTCIAPENTVCVWSPAEYPAYWEQEKVSE